jgi:hypothetical protein
VGVVINYESELGKELLKWEMFPKHMADGTVLTPGNPYNANRQYPKMLYKAQPFRTGKTLVAAPPVSPFGWTDPNQYQQALIEAEAFTKSCQRIVKDEADHAIAKGQGWCETQPAAIAQHEAEQDAISKAAAEAAFAAQRMSEKARAEFDAASDASDVHVTDVPAPVRRRGRPVKVAE